MSKRTPKKKLVKRKKKKKASIFDKLTDSSQYTGAHKHRFNADGTGRGKAGRESIPKGTGSDRGTPWTDSSGAMSAGGYNSPVAPSQRGVKKKKTPVKKKKIVKGSTGSGGAKRKVVRKKKKKAGGGIFDRLTDTSKYTGSHKSRFNADGTGRGQAGRDLGAVGAGTNRGNPW